MTITLTVLVLSLAAGFAVVLTCALKAPEGYEDKDGFHAVLAGNPPKPVTARMEVPTRRAAA